MSDPIVAADKLHKTNLNAANRKFIAALWDNHANLLLARGVKPLPPRGRRYG